MKPELMKHVLLDIDVVADLCVERPGSAGSREAIELARSVGATIWIYTGSVWMLMHSVCKEIDSAEPGHARDRARALLASATVGCQWLAALSGEGNVFDHDRPEAEQLIRAMKRFPNGDILLLSRDGLILSRHREVAIDPEEFVGKYRQVDIPQPMDFIDLKGQQNLIRSDLEENIHRVLHHGRYILGPEIDRLEGRLAEYVGVEHCITASSGTDTLLIAMMALGIGPGDEVITTPFTFIATGETIALLGAIPVFVDIDPRTYNIDPDLIEQSITPRTRAIMPVSLYGQCAEFEAINAIAERHGLPVIEDGAQSFGATRNGRRSCGLSTIGSTSFFPSKPLGGYGDAGALFTNDVELARVMREIRAHGQERRYYHSRIGINGRMDTLQAAIVLSKLHGFEREIGMRHEAGARYTDTFRAAGSALMAPSIADGNTHIYAQYTIQVRDRERVQHRLRDAGIPTAIHYPMPLHRQPAFTNLVSTEPHLPEAEKAAGHVISLPLYPGIGPREQTRVCDAVLQAIE